jgi:hypothetical protein
MPVFAGAVRASDDHFQWAAGHWLRLAGVVQTARRCADAGSSTYLLVGSAVALLAAAILALVTNAPLRHRAVNPARDGSHHA